MSVEFNHTIVFCRDQRRSATFLAELLGLPAPHRFGPFLVVQTANGVSLDFDQVEDEIVRGHYAFLVGEDDFDRIFGRICEQRLAHWADPGRTLAGQTYTHNGGRGVYFEDPDGHLLEILTRPYSSGGFEPV